ncbi:MAG: NUDIX hydrolase [Saprospiraceae bacterium]|nr:NUDIX hydrolase [Saprospiraceae bacterium]
MNFCSNCGQKVQFGDIEGDHRPRFHCLDCGTIHYQNPRVIVGCIPVWEDKVMLCKRGIEPQFGLWNIPGGFMENSETVEEGAAREMFEETKGRVRIIGLQSMFTVLHVNQVHLHFVAEMQDLNYETTPESTDIQLFTEGELPWKEVAFASNYFALKKYFEDRKLGVQRTHRGSLSVVDGKFVVRGENWEVKNSNY